MSIFDNLNIEPGYAVIYHHVMDYTHLFVKSQLEANGFTVQECLPPCDELNNSIVIRRINLPNLNDEAYIYMFWNDFDDATINEAVDSLCKKAFDIQDPQKGHLQFIREAKTGIRSKLKHEGGLVRNMSSLITEDDDEDEIDEAEREDNFAVLIATKSTKELFDMIGKLIKHYALTEHTVAPIDKLLEAIKSKMIITHTTPSPIYVNKKLEVFLPGFDNMEFGLSPRQSVVYSLFLRHPKGIFMNSLDDYLQEVIDLIEKAAPGGKYRLNKDSAMNLCQPKSDAMNEVISDINKIISCKLNPCSELDKLYRITGSRGDAYKIEMANQTTFE